VNLSRILNATWMLWCSTEAWAFRRATERVVQTQAEVLATIVRRNRDTHFGREYRFDRIDGARAYQEHVPLGCYDTYAEAVRRIEEGERGVLTRDPVVLLEPTSGTTSGEKLIPHNAPLRRQFQRAVAAWVFDLFWHRPSLRRGRSYWSISPAMGKVRRTPAGIPIGFDDDAAYLGGIERWLVERLLVVPSAVTRLAEIESFHYCTLWFLLQADDLTSISIWNPSFLMSLLMPLESWHERLCFDLRHGRPQPPAGLSPEIAEAMVRGCRNSARRSADLKEIFQSHRTLGEKLRLVWPMLGLISCWADAGAAPLLRELGELFPGVEIQPKGLMATEAAVSFPVLRRPGTALAVRSHFFEFQELAIPQHVRLAHELDLAGRYNVIVTTGGGLYRYQLRDEIEVVGFLNECPLLRFVGKSDCVSDLVGEKLAEPHVRAVVRRALEHQQLLPRFALLVPVLGRPPHYRLYLQTCGPKPSRSAQGDLALRLESGLGENPHYAYARRLGQLGPAEVQTLDCAGPPGWEIYRRHCLDRGIRDGDIKPLVLDAATDWPDVFLDASEEPRR
jgi:hypothetical protein